MKVLHIIRDNKDYLAHQMIEALRNIEGVDQTLLLIQDGIYLEPQVPQVFACSDDVISRGVKTNLPLVNQAEIVAMIFNHDKIITW